MALKDTGKAIGSATDLIKYHLENALSGPPPYVTVLRPEPPSPLPADFPNPRLNLFLYEVQFDPTMKNLSLDETRPAPFWLVLKYLMTAFDENGDSESIDAYELLGEGLRSLMQLNFLEIRPAFSSALQDNPEPLKITFDEPSVDLLSKLMSGAEERYRFSMAFQVRPVMIDAGEPPERSLLVGMDYTKTPIEEIGEKGVNIDVLLSPRPAITSVSPARFEPGDDVTLFGSHLNLDGVSVLLGGAPQGVVSQKPDRLTFRVDETLARGHALSAGSHAIRAIRTLPDGGRRTGNSLLGNLAPNLKTAVAGPLSLVSGSGGVDVVTGDVTLTGALLGTDRDEIIAALYANGKVVKAIQLIAPPPPASTVLPTQVERTLTITTSDRVPPGAYRLILLVNSQQAANSPELNLTP